MPRGDRTGPDGAGAMTGRGAGFCNGYDTPGYANTTMAGQGLRRGGGLGLGRGMRLGRGFGRGLGRGFGFALVAKPVNDIERLKSEESALKDRLKDCQAEISKLNS